MKLRIIDSSKFNYIKFTYPFHNIQREYLNIIYIYKR